MSEFIEKGLEFIFDTLPSLLEKVPKGILRILAFFPFIIFFSIWMTIFIIPAIILMILSIGYGEV